MHSKMAASMEQSLSKVKSPFGGEKVYKDECAFSYDTPECDTGLYVCMTTFRGFGKDHVERHFKKTGNNVFLHMKRIVKEIPRQEDDPPQKKPTKLAIGIEGGFDTDEKKYEVEEENAIVVLPEWKIISLSDPTLPGEVQISAAAILGSESASRQEELAALAGTWDGEKRVISKYADNLPQHENTKKIPPSNWKCEQCDKTENLWLNLTDGSILCGRRYFDGTGGNNHAVEHYEQVKHPLAVKLGTITPDGGDVYSYAEDDMVDNPNLAHHLAHWGIDIMKMQKTDKTMVELEIDLNQKLGEWDVMTEAGSVLVPCHGPGYTGMINLGNSCYMNSVMQVLMTVPDFQKRFFGPAAEIFQNAPSDPYADFNVQMAKLSHGLLSGDYSKAPPPEPEDAMAPRLKFQTGVKPLMFKSLIGKGHPEFSTKRQQDAQEFLLHLLNSVERNSRGTENPCEALKYRIEERIQCTQSNKVKYTTRTDFILALPVPMEAATNKAEFAAYEEKKKKLEAEKKLIDSKEIVRPRISLAACIDAFAQPEFIDGFYSSAVQAVTTAKKTTRMSTFPDYLMVQLKKFTIGEDWVPKKLAFELDMGTVDLLADMGFPVEACKKGVFHTKNSGVEPAMNWVMAHMDDPDFAAPFEPPTSQPSSAPAAFVPNEEALMMIMSMGFTRDQAIKALKATDNNVERAADWIFSHAAELDAPMETDQNAGEPQPRAGEAAAVDVRTGGSKYRLVGFISHMGTSTLVGHYVCHILKDGKWTIFNDEKVALSENPPKDLAYLYLYERV